jgi:small subunit ribosomal protein S4
MGDPKKPKKGYKKPGHPWVAERIKEEIRLKKEYGLSNKREIWKMVSKLREWRNQARHIVSLQEEQRIEAEKALTSKLYRLGILNEGDQIDDILALDIRTILDRRLQSQTYSLGLANSSKQARQFILHGKIEVNGKVVTAPSYLVKLADKLKLISGFAPKIQIVVEAPKKRMQENLEAPKEKTDAQVVEEAAKAATKEAKK